MKSLTLGLRTRLALLSALVMTVAVLFLVSLVISLFSAGLRQGTDQLLRTDSEAIHGLLLLRDDGMVELFTLAPEGIGQDEFTRHIRFQVRDVDGRVLLSSLNFAGRTLPTPDVIPVSEGGRVVRDIEFDGERLRLRESVQQLANGTHRQPVVVQTVRSIAPFVNQERRLMELLLWALPLPIFLVALGSWVTVTRSLRPINRMIATVRAMGGDDLHRRLPVKLHDEIGRLAVTFNLLLDRVEKSFRSLQRFTADASHELRSPLTALRTQAEVSLSQARSASDSRDVIASMLEELARMEHMVDTLLQLTRADAGMLRPQLQRIDAAQLVADWIERYSALAEEKRVRIATDFPPELFATVDPAIVDRVVANLLANALEFAPSGGEVSLVLKSDGDDVVLKICDSGPGIPPHERERVFERFVRLETGRSRARGAGLGLSIVKWAVDLHHGCVRVGDNAPTGACFEVRLPRAPAASPS